MDAERDRIANQLQEAGLVQSIEWNDGFHSELEGHNGGGDAWHTDGRLAIVVLRSTAAAV
ncbi:MAG: LssY C-terminal domain-containing protein [Methyloceanibacter sp.]